MLDSSNSSNQPFPSFCRQDWIGKYPFVSIEDPFDQAGFSSSSIIEAISSYFIKIGMMFNKLTDLLDPNCQNIFQSWPKMFEISGSLELALYLPDLGSKLRARNRLACLQQGEVRVSSPGKGRSPYLAPQRRRKAREVVRGTKESLQNQRITRLCAIRATRTVRQCGSVENNWHLRLLEEKWFAGPAHCAALWLCFVTSRHISETLLLRTSDVFWPAGWWAWSQRSQYHLEEGHRWGWTGQWQTGFGKG